MKSIWRREQKEPIISQRAETDNVECLHRNVIIIGAGLAGLLTAYYLKEQGKSVLVVEANTIASGQTERTTAKITSQHGVKYSTLIQKIGIKKAKLYAQANEDAIREYERLIEAKKISCQFEKVPSYLFSTRDNTQLYKEAQAASLLGLDVYFTEQVELPFDITGAVCFPNQAQFSPLEFMRVISKDLEIMEHTKVISTKGHKVITEKGIMTADKIIMATHYPIRNIPGFYFLRQHQERSYVLALSGCDKINSMYYSIDQEGFSLRQAGEFLLLGGSSGRTGENKKGNAYEKLTKAAEQYFPGCEEITRWSAQDCMPHDGIPFIGRYSVFTPDLYVVTGFQKWGMTSAMVAAMLLRDEICGLKNPYKKLFSPQRLLIRAGLSNLVHDIGMSVKGLVKGFFHKPKESETSLERGHGGIVTIQGKRYACYQDEAGQLHKISASCPHMGCELTWNPDEKSWDCPCHGSRFDVDGKLLDNPAKTNVR